MWDSDSAATKAGTRVVWTAVLWVVLSELQLVEKWAVLRAVTRAAWKVGLKGFLSAASTARHWAAQKAAQLAALLALSTAAPRASMLAVLLAASWGLRSVGLRAGTWVFARVVHWVVTMAVVKAVL